MILVDLVKTDNFASLDFSLDIKEIARPLALLGITYFNHIRIFPDLSRISLGTHPEWLKHFFEKKYFLHGRFSKKPHSFLQNQAILWKLADDDSVSSDASLNFNIDNGITIIKQTSEYKDFFLFASTRENIKINDFFISNRDLLEKFIAFYLEKSQKILKSCIPDKPITQVQNSFPSKQILLPEIQEKINSFNDIINPKHFYIYHNDAIHQITNTEFLFAQKFLQNKSIKEISSELNIKCSTAYRHSENLRNKLKAYNTDHLKKILKENFLE
jgi:hypothetical protein